MTLRERPGSWWRRFWLWLCKPDARSAAEIESLRQSLRLKDSEIAVHKREVVLLSDVHARDLARVQAEIDVFNRRPRPAQE